jgi:UDP-glucuronate decarboxylase
VNFFQRILVTDEAGFLGSHLCDRLISDGHEVKYLENFLTGSKVNICRLLASKRFEIIRDDITIPL